MAEEARSGEAETVEQTLARARAAARANRSNEAAGICDDLLLAHPDQPAALALLGTVRAQRGDMEAAIGLLERAIAGDATVAAWHSNLCALLRLVNRCGDAVRHGQDAVRMSPSNPQFLVNFALALVDIDERERALACLLTAIGHAPKDAAAHLALGQMLLAQGEMQAGWREYEWRNETAAAQGTMPRMTSPHWNGMRLPGPLLLIGDQGYGDTIQFARYIPMAAARCTDVLVGCSPELAPLLTRMPGVARCLFRWDEIPPHAAHARMSSLPHLFQTEIATIPLAAPYLAAPVDRAQVWAAELDRLLGTDAPRVGLAWAGRPTHPNDRRRSLRLDQLGPILRTPGVRLVSLQKPSPGTEALDGWKLLDLADRLADFADTAAVMAALDLVVTIDTGAAHLAGALGCPVWVMLPKAADWRWMLDRADSPWYSTMRLFRQSSPGDWDAVIESVADALPAFLAAGCQATRR